MNIFKEIHYLIDKLVYKSINSKSKKWNRIMRDYYKNYSLIFTDCDAYCTIYEGLIYFKKEIFLHPTEEDLFDLLHEIGHCETNTEEMIDCEGEYLATQWAIDNMDKYNVVVSRKYIDEYQDYIFDWWYDDKRNKKKVPTKKSLRLVY